MKPNAERSPSPAGTIDLSFVVIGYNEAGTLKACLDSVRNADLDGLSWELIYVDGGSIDTSMDIAREAGVDRLLGGETRRRAAENRNLGLEAATGRLVQFLDGDMALFPDWPRAAAEFLYGHEDVAAVCGNLEESSPGILFEALQIDWMPGKAPSGTAAAPRCISAPRCRRRAGFPRMWPTARSRCYAGVCATRMTGKSIR